MLRAMMSRRDRDAARGKLEALLTLAKGKQRALVATHNDPDPDAIGAALGLSELLKRRAGVQSTLTYSGILGRAENKAMVEYLHIPLQPLHTVDCSQYDLVALMDTQPGHGNQPFGADCKAQIVVDHHPVDPATRGASFWDVRSEYASTSTIVTWYLRDARIRLSPNLATALFYGVKTDTLGLSRPNHPDDARAYVFLQQRAEASALARIENASVSSAYFQALDDAMHGTRIYDGLVVARLGEMRYPDMAAEVADFLLRLEQARIVLAVGRYGSDVIVSLRAPERGMCLDELVQQVISGDGSAGGHDFMAAGRVPANMYGLPEVTEEEMVRRFAAALGLSHLEGIPLLE